MFSSREKEVVQKILEFVGVDLDICLLVRRDEINTTIITIPTQNPQWFLGEEQEVLRSINYLVRQAIPLTAVIVDVDDFYADKFNSICAKALVLSKRVISFGRQIALEPSNSYERRLVHTYIAINIPQIQSVSEGVGIDRYIVLSKKPTQ